MSDVLLVRHGRTNWNDDGRIQGWAPVRLDETGREQAERVGSFLAETTDVRTVVTSDLARTHQTATAIAEATGADIEPDPRLRERDFGRYQGLHGEELFDRFPRFDLLEHGEDAVTYRPESGESWADVYTRVGSAWEAVRDRDRPVVIVSHVNPIRLLCGVVIGDGTVTITETVNDANTETVSDPDTQTVNGAHAETVNDVHTATSSDTDGTTGIDTNNTAVIDTDTATAIVTALTEQSFDNCSVTRIVDGRIHDRNHTAFLNSPEKD